MRYTMPDNGKPFVKGQSGNPAGGPRGSRNSVAAGRDLVFDDAAEKIAAEAIEMALGATRKPYACALTAWGLHAATGL